MRKILLLALLAINAQAEEITYYGCEKKEGSPTIAIVHIKEKFMYVTLRSSTTLSRAYHVVSEKKGWILGSHLDAKENDPGDPFGTMPESQGGNLSYISHIAAFHPELLVLRTDTATALGLDLVSSADHYACEVL